ncbi:MAG: alkaline phosphatase family protein [Bryobacteraceae bacterium]|nr:alkaline phosphatase family protein [Bryobacteraceae bacterium]
MLGMDGLDPNLVDDLIAAGRAPNFKKLKETGSYSRLGTTMPALSPVAWSSFITGLTPGGHGIADFIVRDPQTYMPFFSIWEAKGSGRTLSLGDYQIPLSGGSVVNRRAGKPFWSYLTEEGIPASVIKIPTNFPVEETATRAVSGMGTPDLIDSFGVFNYFTSDATEEYKDLSGGNIIYVSVRNHRVDTELYGPANALRKPKDASRNAFVNSTRVPFTVQIDPSADAVRIDISGRRIVLNKGEYSEWVRVDFEMLPMLSSVSGIARFYLREAHPHLRLYVTPINIDPENQAMPVTYPAELGVELARAVGPFWTKGLPCDTKAFDYRVLDDEGYAKQAELLLEETLAMFDYEWSRFKEGFFYYYVSNTDQDAHMLWRNMDPTHPMHKASDLRYAGYLPHLYEQMDKMVGKVLPAADNDTVVLICSDHGFAQFGRQFHLNTWLRDQGYLTLTSEGNLKDKTAITDIDWEKTAAYGIGFNGLYINQEGREWAGRVGPGKREDLVERISKELEQIVDPETGKRPVAKVYRREDLYTGEFTFEMPDLLVGYTPGYRSSSGSVLGETGKPLIDINPWAWSGDHSMAKDLVPGCLFSSVPLQGEAPNIVDLPVTILDYFGFEKPPQMTGRSLLRSEATEHRRTLG